MATQTLTVKVADFDGENKFEINFSKQKTISAAPGDIIVFDQSDSSNTGHPLRIALYPDGEHKIDAGMPESFNVLVKEIRSLALDIDLERFNK